MKGLRRLRRIRIHSPWLMTSHLRLVTGASMTPCTLSKRSLLNGIVHGFVGRTQYDSPDVDNEVIVRGKNLRIGTFYDVESANAKEYDLMGRLAR